MLPFVRRAGGIPLVPVLILIPVPGALLIGGGVATLVACTSGNCCQCQSTQQPPYPFLCCFHNMMPKG